MEIQISELNTYPIKGCAASKHNRVEVDMYGLQHDREWMLVDDNDGFITQRRFPELARVNVGISQTALHINAPGNGTLRVPLDEAVIDNPYAVHVDFFNKPGTGIYQGPDAQNYFSDFLGKSVRLIRAEKARNVKDACRRDGAAQQIGFADGFPILLTSEQSLAQLNTNLKEPVPMNRFRPNIVVTAPDLEAYDEDYWRSVEIGWLQAYVVRACARCPVPNIDQTTGTQNRSIPVTKALRKTRSGIDPIGEANGYFFGQNLVHVLQPGVTINIRDVVTVLERSDKPNIN